MRDLTYREFHVLLPLAFFTVLVGIVLHHLWIYFTTQLVMDSIYLYNFM